MRTMHALTFLGRAPIGFDLDRGIVDDVRHRMAFAHATHAQSEPSVTYRRALDERGNPVIVRHDEHRVNQSEAIGTTVEDLIDDLHLTIALHATEEVFVHAGVVEWNGSAIVLPGRSHSGKSTLVHALVEAGATYYSDEYARITANGDVAPYPRPIHLRTPSGRRLIDAAAIGLAADSDTTIPVGLIVFAHYAENAAFAPQHVSGAQAALELLDNTVIADVAPQRSAGRVAIVSRRATAIRSARPEAAAVAASILDLAGQTAPAA